MSARLYRLGTAALQVVVIGAISLALLDGLVAFSFRYPTLSPIPRTLLRQLHVLFDRNTIQVMPECAVYDDTLTYTLRPGRCRFANREFDTAYHINSLGLRDDEASLARPQVVMLGDSVTMGWGVEQDEAFPAVFERATGLVTLNAGVSSYGTVRELRLLQRIDRHRLTQVVIQYSGNDFGENQQFVSGAFANLSRDDYDRTVQAQARMRRYHPGKHALNLLVLLRNLAGPSPSAPAQPTPARQAEVFLQVLAQSPVDLAPYDITVVSLESPFIDALRSQAAAATWSPVRRLRLVDASAVAAIPGAFFVLDDHPTRIGHQAIARLLAEAIAGNTPQP